MLGSNKGGEVLKPRKRSHTKSVLVNPMVALRAIFAEPVEIARNEVFSHYPELLKVCEERGMTEAIEAMERLDGALREFFTLKDALEADPMIVNIAEEQGKTIREIVFAAA